MEKTKSRGILMGILFGICALICATALGLAIIHVTDFPYVVDVAALNIAETSGLPEEEIMKNYDAVMDYLSPTSRLVFDLPSLKYSPEGAAHFADCKQIFGGVYALGMFAAAFLFSFFMKHRQGKTALNLKVAGVVTLAVPLTLGIGITFGFDRVFLLFHKVFFSGDTWIFDPAVDEIIKILPAEFFMHCALFIAAFWVLAAVIELLLARKGTKTE